MDFHALAAARRSVRDFTGEDVPDALISKLLEDAHWAPSAGNMQPWHFYVVKNKETQKDICEKCFSWPAQWILKAPVLMIVIADPKKSASRYRDRGGDLYCIQDTAAAIQNILLGAHSMGLGACWMGAFSEEACAKVLHLTGDLRPVAILPIGYPANIPAGPGRTPASQAVTWIK